MQDSGNLKVSIYQEPGFGGLSITVWSRKNGKIYMWAPHDLVIKEVDEAECFTPTFRFTSDVSHEFLQAMAEAISNYGVKTDNDHKIVGTLEATREHLKDLQKLVFKGK